MVAINSGLLISELVKSTTSVPGLVEALLNHAKIYWLLKEIYSTRNGMTTALPAAVALLNLLAQHRDALAAVVRVPPSSWTRGEEETQPRSMARGRAARPFFSFTKNTLRENPKP